MGGDESNLFKFYQHGTEYLRPGTSVTIEFSLTDGISFIRTADLQGPEQLPRLFIMRGRDGRVWSGSAWVDSSVPVDVPMTEVDPIHLAGVFQYVLPAGTGNDSVPDSYRWSADQSANYWIVNRGKFSTCPLPADLMQINGERTDGNNAVLKLRQLHIVNDAGDAVHAEVTGGNGTGIVARGYGTGCGIGVSAGGGAGLAIEGNPAMEILCDDVDQPALLITATGDGPSAVVVRNYNQNPAVRLQSTGPVDMQARIPIDLPDPWSRLLPGAYPAGSAGAIVGAISGTRITVQSPAASNGLLRLVQGDSYDDGGLAVTVDWHGPDLAGAESVQLFLVPRDGYRAHSAPPPVTVNCSMQIAGHSVTVVIPITDELSSLFEGTTSDSTPNYVYQIVVAKGGRRHSLALGSAIVRKKVG